MFRFLNDIKVDANRDKFSLEGRDKAAKYKSYRVHRSYTSSKAPRGRIVGVSIGLVNPEHLLRTSVCEVTEHSLYEKQVPRTNSLQDLRMGVSDRDYKCTTCSGYIDTCHGHFGHFVFKLRVYHVSYLNPIQRVLQCVCHSCSRFLLSENDPRFQKIMSMQDPVKRLAEFARVCQGIDYCGGPPASEVSAKNKEKGKDKDSEMEPAFNVKAYLEQTGCGCHTAQRVYIRNKLAIACYLRNKRTSKAPSSKNNNKNKNKTKNKDTPSADQTVSQASKSTVRKRKASVKKIAQGPAKRRKRLQDDASDASVMSKEPPTRSDQDETDNDDDDGTHKENGDNTTRKTEIEPSDIGDGDDEEAVAEDEDANNLSEGGEDDDDDSSGDDNDHDHDNVTDKVGMDVDVDADADADADDVDADLLTSDDKSESKSSVHHKKSTSTLNEWSSSTMGASIGISSKVSLKKRCSNQVALMPDDVFNIFKRIDEKDYEKLGFKAGVTRPQYMILKYFPVSPPCTRLAMISSQGSKSRGETDATKHLKRILGFSNQIKAKYDIIDNRYLSAAVRKQAHLDVHKPNGLFDKLQRGTAAYIDNDVYGVAPVTGHTKMPMKSMVDRFKRKDGRVRGNLNAKRVDFCARTVIGPAVHLDIDQVGVPEFVCTRVTYPDLVSALNIHELRKLVQRGPDVYPGANTIIRRNGEVIDLRYARNRRRNLQIGDIVERHLKRGDVVLFNRQPSLHRMSVMSFLAYPHDGQTFLLNLACTKPFNADFDGDEMNLFVPQNIEAVAEALTIMKVEYQINDPQDKACMGVVQDAQIAAHLCTDKDVFMTREEMMQCASQMVYWKRWRDAPSTDETTTQALKASLPARASGLPLPAIMYRPSGSSGWTSLWTGKQCAALTLPRTECVGVQYSSKLGDRDAILRDDAVCIDDSDILIGRLTKTVIGPTRGGIIQNMVHDFGHEITRRFLSDVQRFFNYWISEYGYGIGISDCISDSERQGEVHSIVEHALDYLKNWSHPNETVQEQHINAVLDAAREQAGVLVQDQRSSWQNRISQMIDSGTKGTKVNLSQSAALVGQIKLGGERVPMSYGERSLPHFPKNWKDPLARAFVRHSFIDGLDPLETYFHAMGGREGLVDTATKTASVGYIGRKLMRCLEDVRVHYDQTVRDAHSIITFAYGGDAIDTSWIETQFYPCLDYTIEDVHRCYDARRHSRLLEHVSGAAQKTLEQQLQAEVDQISEDVQMIRLLKMSTQRRELESEIKAPVHFMRLLRNARNAMKRRLNGKDVAEPIHAEYVLQQVQLLIHWCQEQVRCEAALLQFFCLLRVNLCVVSVLVYNELDKVAFDFVTLQVREGLLRALAQSGEMIGPVAGQSLSQESMQMTLNNFHLSGVGAKSMAAGIPQLDEFIRVTHKPRASSLDVYLMPEFQSKSAAYSIIKKMKPLVVSKFIEQHDIFFDPDATRTVIVQDQALVDAYQAVTDGKDVRNWSSFVLRFVVDRDKCRSYGKTINHVFWAMKSVLPDGHQWIKSPVNGSSWVLRLRLKTNSSDFRKYEKKKISKKTVSSSAAGSAAGAEAAAAAILGQIGKLSETQTCKHVRMVLLNTRFHGIDGIVSATIRSQPRIDWDSKTLKINKRDEVVIETRGSNMRAVMNLPGVDFTRVLSTNVVEVEQLLGIEAATTVLMNNIQRLFVQNGSYVNYHHVYTLATSMSKTGTLVGLNRNGFHQNRKLGFLKRCSFEKIVRVLTDSAQLGEVDMLNGVASNIIIGNAPPIGTSTTAVYYQSDKQVMEDKRDVIENNQVTLANRLMDPVEQEDLVRLIPSFGKKRVSSLSGSGWHAPATASNNGIGLNDDNDRYEQMIADKNTQRIVPDYSSLLVSATSNSLPRSALVRPIFGRNERERRLAEQQRREDDAKRLHGYIFSFPMVHPRGAYDPEAVTRFRHEQLQRSNQVRVSLDASWKSVLYRTVPLPSEVAGEESLPKLRFGNGTHKFARFASARKRTHDLSVSQSLKMDVNDDEPEEEHSQSDSDTTSSDSDDDDNDNNAQDVKMPPAPAPVSKPKPRLKIIHRKRTGKDSRPSAASHLAQHAKPAPTIQPMPLEQLLRLMNAQTPRGA